MAEENNVTFSKEFLLYAENKKKLNELLSFIPEELAEQTKMLFRAFAKHGVPAKTVIDALAEFAMEGGFNDG